MDLRQPHVQHSVLEVFTRVWLRDLSDAAGTRITLATVPDSVLQTWSEQGFHAVWLMGVWTLGPHGKQESLALSVLREEYTHALPGWNDDDVPGSPYAVADYVVDEALGGPKALAAFRKRLHARGMALWLDFVPNHTARDHGWVTSKPELFVHLPDGSVAAGKDPYFPPWTDTAQLDHRTQETQRALTQTLLSIADQCDGVRCDMAMLVLPDIMQRTWAHAAPARGTPSSRSLWSMAIPAVRAVHPAFVFMAEAYWGLEYRLQLLGFDFTYDKTLYDRLMAARPSEVSAHLDATADYQARSVRFVENHDEPRVASRLSAAHARAATVVAMTVPGLRFFHDGQREGRRIKLPVQLARRPTEKTDADVAQFHDALFRVLQSDALVHGSFLKLRPSHPSLIAHRWEHPAGSVVVLVNLSGAAVGGKTAVPLHGVSGQCVELRCVLTGHTVTTDGDALLDGVWMELPAWGARIFTVAVGVA